MKKLYLGLVSILLLLSCQNLFAQVTISSLPTTITQNFNGLSSTLSETWTDNSLPASIQPGWYSSSTNLNLGTGSSASGGIYNFGSASNPDRALGALSIGATAYQFGIRIKNTGSIAIGSFSISFTGEQWRQNTSQILLFEYFISSSPITTISPGAFTSFSALNFASPDMGAAGALDGNLSANRTAKAGTLNVSVLPGSEIMFRWARTGGSSPGLAIDDLTIIASATYSLVYNGNGSTSGSAPVDVNSPYTSGSSVTVLGQGTLLKTGYTFSGWNTSADGLGTTYATGATFTVPSANSTLYAIWTPVATPILAINGTPTFHGSVCPGTPATSVQYTITNTGATASGVTVVSSDPQFVVSGLSGTTVAGSGGTVTYNVTFTPSSAGSQSGVVTINSTTPGSNSPTSSLTGTGITPIAGTVTTVAASSLNNTLATLNGNVTSLSICPSTSEKGFVYSLTSVNPNPVIAGSGVTKTLVGTPATGAYSLALTSLTAGTSYSYRSYLFDGTSYSYGAVTTFVTLQAADHLVFVNVPSTGNVGVDLTSFTVEARRPDNSVDNNSTVTITIAKATGAGNFAGTLSVSAVAGVATFTMARFDAVGTYTISASSPTLSGATSSSITITNASLSSDYFRSNVPVGSWSDVGSWQSSHDNSFWFAATLVPTSSANAIKIVVSTIITVSTSITLDQVAIDGTFQLQTGGKFSISDGVGDDITINSGGILRITSTDAYAVAVNQASGADIKVLTNGKIVIGDGSATIGANYDNFATSANNIWNDGAIYEYNSLSQFNITGLTYFPGAGANIIPIFRVTAVTGSPGGTMASQINGLLEVNTSLSLTGSGDKVFRNGISGTATLTQSGTGSFKITGLGAILGGTSLQINLISPLNISASCTVPFGKKVTVSGGSIDNNTLNNIFTVNGTIDINTISITNTNASIVVNGKILTSNPGGFTGTGSAIPSGSVTLNAGSTVEYNALTAQDVSPRSDYYHITFSGGGVKTLIGATHTPIGGTIYITGNAIVDAGNKTFGSSLTNLTMDGGRFKMSGVGVKPDMDGAYALTGGTIEFNNSAGGRQNIKGKNGASVDIIYKNIEINGMSVGNGAANITMGPLSTFTLLPGSIFEMSDNSIVATAANTNATVTVSNNAIFKCSVLPGFIGPAGFPNSPSIRDNIENVILQTGSTVDYSRSLSGGDQVITNTQPYQNLSISGNGVKTATSGSTTVLGNFNKTSITSTFNQSAGTFVFSGPVAQSYQSVSPVAVFNNLTNANTSSFNVNDSLGVNAELKLGSASITNISDSKVITLKSSLTKTANLATVPTNAVINYIGTAAFVVERYISTGVNHAKTWQLLTAPTTGQTIKQSWMENGVLPAGYGTIVTGSGGAANGFDISTVMPSMKYYDYLSNSWKPVSNPSTTPIDYKNGYLVFVRGDRSVTTYSAPANQTILRTKGKVTTGQKVVSVPNGYFGLVGNPYPSPVNFDDVTKVGVGKIFYVWDPSQFGAYGLGRYQTISFDGTSKYLATPGTFGTSSGAVAIYNTTSDYRYIQSGQAFFVRGTLPGSSLTFEEIHKSAASSGALVNKGSTSARIHNGISMLRTSLLGINSNNLVMADGNTIFFDRSSSNLVTAEDAPKLANDVENFGLKVQGQQIAVERRGTISVNDTIHYDMSGLKTQPYKLLLVAENISPSLDAFLIDNWLNTKTFINLIDTNFVDINITTDLKSQARDRFMLVFKKRSAKPLPTASLNLTAIRNADQAVSIRWEVSNEPGSVKYEIERSQDGSRFLAILTATAKFPGVAGIYNKIDANPLPGNSFYRIRLTTDDGKRSYSNIVSLASGTYEPSISVYPNPIVDHIIHLRFNNLADGQYRINLVNNVSQAVFSGSTEIIGSSIEKNIKVENNIAAGIYQLTITDADGKSYQQPVIMK